MSSYNNSQSEVTDSGIKDISPEARLESDDCVDARPKPFRRSATRGLIEVEFNKDAPSGVETWDFENEEQRDEFSNYWTPELSEILEHNHLISWKPSFPLLYPWSKECSKESARESYFKAGRDKFVTFKFSLDTDVIRIARAQIGRAHV